MYQPAPTTAAREWLEHTNKKNSFTSMSHTNVIFMSDKNPPCQKDDTKIRSDTKIVIYNFQHEDLGAKYIKILVGPEQFESGRP